MRRPPLSKLVQSLPVTVPFVGPEAQERARGRAFRARLGANESLFGASPKAVRVMQEAALEQWKYSDPENWDLRSEIARFHGVTAQEVVIGEGIDGLLGLAVKLVADPGASIVTSDGAYPTFNFHVVGHGCRIVKVPFSADHEDLGRLLETAARERAAALYVSNPNNPMGTWWSRADVVRLIEALPPGLMLFLDEAYCDTAPRDAVPDIDTSNPQVLRFRTFSKAYGLAGARIGYAVGDGAIIGEFEKVRNHYGINRAGQLGARAALEDQVYLRETVAKISRARDRISDIARRAGLAPIASGANFVTIDCLRDAPYARSVLDGLLSRDVFARKPQVAPLDRCIRVSCGRDEDLDVFEEALLETLRALGG